MAMTKEYRAKVFKSGNSVALRLPKALGLEAGAEMVVREEHGKFRFEPVEKAKEKIDVRDRKSVVEGKSVSVSVDLGGRRIIKKNKKNNIKRTEKKYKTK